METNASLFNPYQALDITRDEPALAPDTEFLFNDKVVAGIGVTLMVAAFASIAACFVFRRSVRVRWYISQQIVNRTFYLRLSILLAAMVTMFVIWFLTAGRFRGGPVMSGLWAVASLTSLIYLIRGKRVLVVIGRHKGLFLVGGLSEKFLIETQRLVEAHAAKKKDRVKLDAAD